MRTNIVIDDELVAEAMRIAGARSKREVVDLPLRELVSRYRQRQIKRLKGNELINPDYDVHAVRKAMTGDPG